MERDSRPKILICSPYPLTEKDRSANGVASYVIEEVPYYERAGFTVRLLGPNVRHHGENSADFRLGRIVTVSRNNTTSQTSVLFNKGLTSAVIRTDRPDIVEIEEPLAGISSHAIISAIPRKRNGRTLPIVTGVFHARSEDLDRSTQFLLLLAKTFGKRPTHKWGIPTGFTPGVINTVMNALDGKMAVSYATAGFWNNIYPSEYVVVPNGINTEELTPEGPEIDSWKDGKKTILFAGRHDERKGIEYLLEAYRLLSETRRGKIKLKITGEGKMTEKLKQIVKEQNLLDVEFVGILSREELVKAYRTADIFVSPATGGEGFGRTLAEAMACGTLTIGSDIDGYREVLGYQPFAGMVEPRNSHDLARQMARFLDLPDEERQRLAQQATKYTRDNFSWEVVIGKKVKIFESLISAHGLPSSEDWPRKERKKKRSMPVSGVVFERLRHR